MPWGPLTPKFESNRAAAARLHAVWKKRFPKEARKVSADSLATKLGDLPRGKRLWWENRPELTELLAELLDCEVSTLLGTAAAPVGHDFLEFPGLPPLSPNETPCRLWPEGGLSELVIAPLPPQIQRRWIHAPAGMGKSLAIRRWAGRGDPGITAVSLRRLIEVADHRNFMGLLVIEVDESDPTGDAETIRTLAFRRAPTVVLAPFALPEPRLRDHQRLFHNDGWERLDPRFGARERERLLQWIDARLEDSARDTRMVAEDVRAWLDRHDPHVNLVATPADLLALCFDFHIHGGGETGPGRRARRWLAGMTAARWQGDARTRTLVERTFVALCKADLEDRSLARGYMSTDDLEVRVPTSVQHGDGPRSGAGLLIEHLRDAGLLRGGAHGLGLAPTWVACAISGETARDLFEGDDPTRWGLLATDASRRDLVDHSLDQLSNAALFAVVRSVLAGPEAAGPLGWIGAREAAFAAAARRLERRNFTLPIREHAAWQQLATLVLGASVMQGERRAPQTRHDVELWWSLTWQFSLRVPPPASLPTSGLGWKFPGWVQRLDFAELPPSFPWSGRMPADPPLAVVRMVALSAEVVARLPEPPPDLDWPRVLLPAVLLAAPGYGWSLSPQVISTLSGTWEEHVFLAEAARVPEAQRGAIAAMLWDLASRVHAPPNETIPVTLRLARMKNAARGLLPFILENLPAAVLEQTIDTHGLYRSDTELDDLKLLPRPLRRRAVAMALAQSKPTTPRWLTARGLAPLLDAEDLDIIIELVQHSDAGTAAEFTEFVWAAAPDRARREATNAFVTRQPAAWAWFLYVPRSELAALLDLVDATGAPLPEWMPDWADSRVPYGGLAAERLYELARARP